MNKFLAGLIGIIIFSFVLTKSNLVIFPSDTLYYLPSFSIEKWQRPHNSLLADPVYQFEPWRHFAKEKLLKGELPIWNSHNGTGAPFLANPQVAMFYPLNIIYYLIPEDFALNLIPLIKIYLFFVATFLFLRLIGCSNFGSYIGSTTATFGGFMFFWVLWPHTNVYILFPLLLYLSENVYRSQKNKKFKFLLISLVYFMGILGGHPETLLHIGLIHFIYFVFRFWRKKRDIYNFMIFTIIGIFLGAFQVIPFIEYVLNSRLMSTRFGSENEFFLPIYTIAFNIYPYLLGAPHEEFYKTISSSLNFQELLGGYVGVAALSIIVIGILKNRKEYFIKFFISILILCIGIVYKIFPFYLLTSLPLINSVANSRLIGITGFALSVLLAIYLSKMTNFRINPKLRFKLLRMSPILIFGIISLISVIFILFLNQIDGQHSEFIFFLYKHVLFITLTTIGMLLCIMLFQSNKIIVKLFILTTILLQTIVLFWQYHPLTTKREYYPSAEPIKILQQIEKGRILEVGNPNLPPNLNLLYGLESAENDDAMQVNSYAILFDNTFQIKNSWNKVDTITLEDAQKLGIVYIISDYDINLNKIDVQKESGILLSQKDNFSISFKGSGDVINQLRFLPANFNRLNNCNLIIAIHKGKDVVSNNSVSCKSIRDKMFYTVTVGEIKTVMGEEYSIEIRLSDYSNDNKITFWGNRAGVPFIQLLAKKASIDFNRIWSRDSVYIFEAKQSSLIDGLDEMKILDNDDNRLYIVGTKKEDGLVTIKRVKYPGWRLEIDNKKAEHDVDSAFYSFNLTKGEHFISLQYYPVSFYIGILLSISTALIILIYLIINLRSEIREKINSLQSFRIEDQKVIQISLISTFTSIALYWIFIKSNIIKFKFEDNFSINWLNRNHYIKALDYFHVAMFIAINLITFLILFIIYRWKRKN